MTDMTIAPSDEFHARIAQAETILTRGLDSGERMLAQSANPAADLAEAGYDIPAGTEAEFNAMFSLTTAPELMNARQAIEQGLDTWPSFKCSGCTVVCWGVAAAFVALGAAAAGTLTGGSAVVVSLAGLVGCSTAAALLFLQTLVPLIAKGVAAVAAAICLWTGTCTQADLR